MAYRSGRLAEASARYREAIDGFDAIASRPQLAGTLVDAAEVEVARGRMDVARAHLERAIEVAIESGNTRVEAAARDALAALAALAPLAPRSDA